jgi:hypothetical protein
MRELQESAALEQVEPERPQVLLQGWKQMNQVIGWRLSSLTLALSQR